MTTTSDDLKGRVLSTLEKHFAVSHFDSSKKALGRIVVRVVSPDFDDLDDVDRQVRVWGVLRDALHDDELLALEYVFTDSDAEVREASG